MVSTMSTYRVASWLTMVPDQPGSYMRTKDNNNSLLRQRPLLLESHLLFYL